MITFVDNVIKARKERVLISFQYDKDVMIVAWNGHGENVYTMEISNDKNQGFLVFVHCRAGCWSVTTTHTSGKKKLGIFKWKQVSVPRLGV